MVYSVSFSQLDELLANGRILFKIPQLALVKFRVEILQLKGHKNTVYSAAFSPSGKLLASGKKFRRQRFLS